jgi:hypothetical protein
VLHAYCGVNGRTHSGKVADDKPGPYTSDDLYKPGSSPNYTAIAADGLAKCDLKKLYQPEVLNATAPDIDRLFASFSEVCPGLLIQTGLGVIEPEDAAVYECPVACRDWLLNYGVCSATEWKEGHAQLFQTTRGFEPLTLAPTSCHVAVSQEVARRGGAEYIPTSRSSTENNAQAGTAPVADASRAPATRWGASVFAAVALLAAYPVG